MQKFESYKDLAFSPKQLFDLVTDIEQYPNFLPWCINSRDVMKTKNKVVADLVIRYKAFTEQYRSEIIHGHNKDGSQYIKVKAISGPFDYLINDWCFSKKKTGCHVSFLIDFKFNSFIFNKVIDVFFEEKVRTMLTAFEDRAEEIYG